MRKIALVLGLLTALAASCGDGGPAATTAAPGTTQPATTAPPQTTTTLPVGADEPLLVVRREGGLMPPEAYLYRMPLYVLYGDGRLVYQGAAPAIFPGPLLPAIVQVDVGTTGLADVIGAATAVGLPEITELYNTDAINQVADGPTTEVSYFDQAGEHYFAVYALEIAQHSDPRVLELAGLVSLLDRLAAESPSAGPFPIERLQVIASDQTADPSDPLAVVVPWPMSMTPAEMDVHDMALRCGVVVVEDDPGALEAFRDAHQMTFFTFSDTVYRLTVRPLLPGEDGCAPRTR